MPSLGRSGIKKAASRSRALSAEALEQLGAARLAELLMAQTKGDAALARTLRLAIASTDGGGRLAAEVEKRLRTIGRSRGFITWDKLRPLARELDGLRETIAGSLAAADPRAAVAQMRQLLGLAGNVFERSDDGSGALGEVFRQAGADLGRLWASLPHRDPLALAREVLALWDSDGYGETDRLLEAAGPALGPEGQAELRRLLEARLATLPRPRKSDVFESGHGRGQITFRLRDLADLGGDVDAYIAATEAGGRAENFAGDIAERLITHGRPHEALIWLDRPSGRHESEAIRRTDLRLAALEALGQREEAQALRWDAFRRWLTPQHLRPYLRGLPDFDDVEAEDRAVAHALAHADRNLALSFLAGWPRLDAANRLVRAHHEEMDGRDYGRLRPAAEALAERYPAAATLLHRVLAEDVLRRASSRQYTYAVRDVRSCASLALLLPMEPDLESHEMFLARLRREHGRKAGFWTLLEDEN
ncbi:hypothetical protein CR162_18850 [Pseudoroseomonas rhizosphaerae]|uniref:Uncharacterized protein n=1 Tax=Teichococcus rhizosphaerae TaxID=1335062 RepID=A0A2C7A8M9_9PROT|nr:DUF6880 family protein [Pseudoroseomonas rhizosphaerae]PHK93396.1 hypothetical protein CR162_18850 [Pseudoroseomonas rhizosphaerae]